jgi:hypothetical protein
VELPSKAAGLVGMALPAALVVAPVNPEKELNGWSSPQMLQRYGGSARGARARRHYDLIMRD